MLFEKIHGHDGIRKRLSQDLTSKRFQGVYLFTGPSSVGKFTVARQLARYILCTGLVDDSCRCETCRLFPNVPDYYEVSKGDDTIVTADVDGLIDFVSLVPYRSTHRVALIDNAQNLYHSAESSLLKTFEDISDNCVVILVTNRPEALLPTILSRCYQIEFGPLGSSEILSVLKSKGHETGHLDDMERMLPYLAGNVLVDFGKYSEHVKYVPQFVKRFPTMKEDEVLTTLKEIEDKQELSHFIEVFIMFLNDIMKVRYDSPDVIVNVKHLDFIEDISKLWKEDICELFIEKLRSAQMLMNRSINLKFGQFVYPIFQWGSHFMKKEKSASEPK